MPRVHLSPFFFLGLLFLENRRKPRSFPSVQLLHPYSCTQEIQPSKITRADSPQTPLKGKPPFQETTQLTFPNPPLEITKQTNLLQLLQAFDLQRTSQFHSPSAKKQKDDRVLQLQEEIHNNEAKLDSFYN